MKFGRLYTRAYGNLRISRGDKRRKLDVGRIELQSNSKGISLDDAIKKEQKRKAEIKAKKDKIKAERIRKLKNAIRRLQ